jgi:hypothetical protein
MKKYFFLLLIILVFNLRKTNAQCSGTAITYTVDLSSKTDTAWTFSSTRSGNACTGTNCIQFVVILNPLSTTIGFDVTNPAPGGGATYQVNCGASISIGTPLCVSGLSTFCLSYCKNGGDSPNYNITATSSGYAGADRSTRVGCPQLLNIAGLLESTVTWTSVSPGAAGSYNSYLSCTSACDSTYVNPSAGAPAYIDYAVTGNLNNGCGSHTDTMRISIVPQFSLSISSTDSLLCSGATQPVTLTANASGGIPPYTFLWQPGNQTTPAITVSTAEVDSVFVYDSVPNCGMVQSYTVSNGVNQDIAGKISYSGGVISSSPVFLIAQGSSSALYDTIATVSTSGAGYYSFPSVAIGNYYLRAEATSYPGVVNTYFGNNYLWDSSTVISHGCAAPDSAHILMLESPSASGAGFISGYVYEGPGFGSRLSSGISPVIMYNIIPGVPVKVGKNPNGYLVATAYTDTTGYYSFDSLPLDSYTIYTDIPGYPMDSTYSVVLSAGNDSVFDLIYFADSNSVYIDLSNSVHYLDNSSDNTSKMISFPNPAHDLATIHFCVNENSTVTFDLFDLQGQKIATLLNRNFEKGIYYHSINLSQLEISSGTYLIQCAFNNQRKAIKLIVIR